MRIRVAERFVVLAAAALALAACDDKEKAAAEAAQAAKAAAAKAAAARAKKEEPPPAGCQAKGDKPVELGSAVGTVHGFVSSGTSVYYTTWQIYGSRGDLAELRKDGAGATALLSLELEPRGLLVDGDDVYFTEGIRLRKLNKKDSKSTIVAPKFSSQSIAADAKYIYGVPGDYGPYDRLVRKAKGGGPNYELDVAERPEVKKGPVGYSALLVDASGVYVTDSGNHRVLRFPLERGKPKTLAARQDQAFALATDGSNLFFTLARKGKLMKVSKAGGKVSELVSGLAPEARIAADSRGVYAPFAGAAEDDPWELAQVPPEGGERTTVARLAPMHTVQAVALDDDCVYWADRESGSGKLTFYAQAR